MPTDRLSFPFWVVTRKRAGMPVPVAADDLAGYVAAFSSVGKAAGFMADTGEPGWEFQMVGRATFGGLVAGLRRLGVQGLYLDPGDGTGTRVEFGPVAPLPAPGS